MFRALVNLLSFEHKPSFADWPETDAESPLIDLVNRHVGPLRFGAALDEARALGRPDRFERDQNQRGMLLYARLGLILEIDAKNGFDYAALLVAPDLHDPAHPLLVHRAAHLVTGASLTAQTTESDLRALFGPPQNVDRDADETVLHHQLHGLTLECELTPGGLLKRVNLFPITA